MYIIAIISTLVAWFIGWFLDVDINMNPDGHFRVLLPILAMGLCILYSIKEHKEKDKKEK